MDDMKQIMEAVAEIAASADGPEAVAEADAISVLADAVQAVADAHPDAPETADLVAALVAALAAMIADDNTEAAM